MHSPGHAQLLGEVPQPTGLLIRVQVMRFGLADHDQFGLRNHCHRTHQGVESLVGYQSSDTQNAILGALCSTDTVRCERFSVDAHRYNRDPVSRSAPARQLDDLVGGRRRHPIGGLRHHRLELYAFLRNQSQAVKSQH